MTRDPLGGWQAFSEAARRYFDEVATASSPDAAQRFSDFLREQFASYAQPWGSGGGPGSAVPPGVLPDLAMLSRLAFGATREHQLRAQRLAEAAQRIDAARRRLERLWSDVLRDAATKFVSQLLLMQSATIPEGLRKLYDLWIDCAEQAYAQVAHGEAFCQAQADLVNAGTQWRLEQQSVIEQWAKLFDLPTRSEINTLTQRLRALEAKLRRCQAAPAPSGVASPKRAARNVAAKRSGRSKQGA